MKSFLFFYFLVLYVTLCSGSEIEALQLALDKLDYNVDIFSYESKILESDDNKTTENIVRYNPEGNIIYTLLLHDGKRPTESDIVKYNKQRLKDENKSGEMNWSQYKYTLISSNSKQAEFSFIANEDLIPKVSAPLSGVIWLNLKEESVDRIELKNIVSFIVFPGVKIKKFSMAMKFKEYSENYSVIDKLNLNISGKAIIKDFKQKIETEIYNYEIIN